MECSQLGYGYVIAAKSTGNKKPQKEENETIM